MDASLAVLHALSVVVHAPSAGREAVRAHMDALVADAAEIDAVLADMDAAWLVQLTASTRYDRYRPRPPEKQQNPEILQISAKLSHVIRQKSELLDNR